MLNRVSLPEVPSTLPVAGTILLPSVPCTHTIWSAVRPLCFGCNLFSAVFIAHTKNILRAECAWPYCLSGMPHPLFRS